MKVWYRQIALCGLVAAAVACQSNSGLKHDTSNRDQAAQYNMQLAVDYFRQGDLKQAKEKIEKSLEQNPRNAEGQATAGLIFDRLGEERVADEHFSRAVALDKNPDILNNYAVFLCRKGKVAQGMKYAQQAASDPLYRTPDVAYTNMGLCALNGGNKADAEKYFRQALAVRPQSPDALYQLAQLEFDGGNFLAARAFLERYVAAAPVSPPVLLLGAKIEQQLGNRTGADSYTRRLRSEFPSSLEAKQSLETAKTGG